MEISVLREFNHRRNAFLRRVKLWLADKLTYKFSRYIKQSSYEANLVLRLDGKIGDAVTSTGFLKQIKLKYPNEKLIVMVNGGGQKEIFKNLKYIDEIVDIQQLGIVKSFLKLKSISFRYIISTTHILKPKMIFVAAFLKAHCKITFENLQIKTFSEHIKIDFINDHITDRYRKILKAMGLQDDILIYDIQLNDTDVEYVKKIFSQAGIKKVIALNSFAGARDRNLSAEKTIEIVKNLVENTDCYVVSLASKNDGEKIKIWMQSFSHARWRYFPELDTLEKNMALLSACDLIITPDTAWVHIASALRVKLVALFREDNNPYEINSTIWAPYQTLCKIVKIPGTTMENIDTNEVTNEVLKII